LWGSPYVKCRIEADGVHYYSNAFERKEEIRRQAWAEIPDGLDVLVTHAPPRGDHSDPLLELALGKLARPPLVHVWGHWHRGFGLGLNQSHPSFVSSQGFKQKTHLWFNAAQDHLLHQEPDSGGFPWVFDVPAVNSD
jgi:hypothetical protein